LPVRRKASDHDAAPPVLAADTSAFDVVAGQQTAELPGPIESQAELVAESQGISAVEYDFSRIAVMEPAKFAAPPRPGASPPANPSDTEKTSSPLSHRFAPSLVRRQVSAAYRSTVGTRGRNYVSPVAANALSRAASSSGYALPHDIRARFETSLSADLSRVRIHTGAESAYAANAIGAKAYALGEDIYFGAGAYSTDRPGLRLLAHEVAHTQQPDGGPSTPQPKLEVSSPDDAAEIEAERAAAAMVEDQPATLTVSRGGASRQVIHRGGPDSATATKVTWDPTHLYEDDGLVPASDHYQAGNNLQMLADALEPVATGGAPAAQLVRGRVIAKKAALAKDGDLTESEASDLKALGDAALMAYVAGVKQMKDTLLKALSQYKNPPGLEGADEKVAELLHEGFTGEHSLLEHAKHVSHYLHVANENIHHLVEMAETAHKEVTMIQHWFVKPHHTSFEKILEKGGEFLHVANLIHAAVQALWSSVNAIQASGDSSKSSAQKGAAGIEAGSAVVTAGLAAGTFIGIAGAASMGLIWADLVGPQTEKALEALAHLDKFASNVARKSLQLWWADEALKGAGPPIIPKEFLAQNWFPGGQATLNYMWAVFQGNAPEIAPGEVTKLFYENRKKFNEGHEGDELDTEWHLFRANEVKNLKEWVQSHKTEVWGMLYGSLPHP
jgi:hypothetical protein